MKRLRYLLMLLLPLSMMGQAQLLTDMNPGTANTQIQQTFSLSGTLVLWTDTGLWGTDGDAAGTALLASGMEEVYQARDSVYFRKGLEFWATDGTPGGTVMKFELELVAGDYVFQLANGTTPDTIKRRFCTWYDPYDDITYYDYWYLNIREIFFLEGSWLFFAEHEDQYCVNGYEREMNIWTSDGTAADTRQLSFARDSYASTYEIRAYGNNGFEDYLLFTEYYNEGGVLGDYSLWAYFDGYPGPEKLGVFPGSYGANLRDFENIGEDIYFNTRPDYDATCTSKLFRTDGTQVYEIFSSPVGFDSYEPYFGGVLVQHRVVTAGYCDGYGSYTSAPSTVLTDGTAAGTKTLADYLSPITRTNPLFLKPYKDPYNIYVRPFGDELYVSDGTTAGTHLLKDIRPGTEGSDYGDITEFNGNFFFYADDGTHGRELWKTDGTTAGTHLFMDLQSGSASGFQGMLGVSSQGFFFRADDGVQGTELWFSDGTTAGTRMVLDMNPGVDGSYIGGATVLHDALIFTASIAGQRALLSSNGTVVETLSPLYGIGGMSLFKELENHLLLRFGDQLWVTDGSVGGTALVSDAGDWVAGSEPIGMVHDKIIFFGQDAINGAEPWSYEIIARLPGLQNGDFKLGSGDMPDAWTTASIYPNDVEFTWEEDCLGGRLVSIHHPNVGNSSGWRQTVSGLVPGETYYYSGWIKGENIVSTANETGAVLYTLLPNGFRPLPSLRGTFDWTYVTKAFIAPASGSLTLGAGIGIFGGSKATGQAWFDDLKLSGPGIAEAPATVGLQNGSMELGRGESPVHWSVASFKPLSVVYEWEAAGTGVNNSRSISITHATEGNDSDWQQLVTGLTPGASYSFSGSIKGENVVNTTGTVGATLYTGTAFNHSPDFNGTFGWTTTSVNFVASSEGTMLVGCRLGYFGSLTTGKAWFDDLHLSGPGLGQEISIDGFVLINSLTDEVIQPLEEGDIIDLTCLGFEKVNIRAMSSPYDVGSVRFALNGNANERTENNPPFALAGSSKQLPVNYYNWIPDVGAYTLTASPYSASSGSGTVGISKTISFTVIRSPQMVTSFSLVDALNNVILGPLHHGDVIDLATIGTHKLNIIAHTFPENIGSVDFDLNGTANFHQYDNQPPYCLAQDNQNGGYYQYLFSPGSYSLTATPYTVYAAGGDAGTPMTIGFTVVNSGARMGLPTETLTAFPNPTTGKLNLQFLNVPGGKAQLYILNLQGQTIEMRTLDVLPGTSTQALQVHDLASGMYVLYCRIGEMRYSTRIIKQ